jgi:hypothetical protein
MSTDQFFVFEHNGRTLKIKKTLHKEHKDWTPKMSTRELIQTVFGPQLIRETEEFLNELAALRENQETQAKVFGQK